MDNCTAHHVVGVNLANIKLEYFPANSTSLLQPLDQGVKCSVKCTYGERLIQRLLLNFRLQVDTKVDIYVAMEMLSAVWAATKSSIMENCFGRAGLKRRDDDDVSMGNAAEDCTSHSMQEQDSQSSVIEAWQALCAHGGVRDDIELEDFLDVDQDVIATKEPTESEIVESVCGEDAIDCWDNEGQGAELSVPTPRAVLDTIGHGDSRVLGTI